MWLLTDRHLRALIVPSPGTPQIFIEHLQYTKCCSSAGAAGVSKTKSQSQGAYGRCEGGGRDVSW